MITIRKSDQRGHHDHGWLDTRHTFSFGRYQDPEHMGYRVLRVINEDRVQPGKGFGAHPHADMEIITFVLAGELAHQDSTGSGEVLRPGDVQVMSAGTGITHSEFNASKRDIVHFIQIWILPSRDGVAPRYEQRHFDEASKRNRLCLIVSGDGRDDSLAIHQDADVHTATLDEGTEVEFDLRPGRYAWVQALRGRLELNATQLDIGDGAAIKGEERLALRSAAPDSGFLLFDLP